MKLIPIIITISIGAVVFAIFYAEGSNYQNISVINDKSISDNICGGENIAKKDIHSLVVLLMRPNSTAVACVTYQFIYDWTSYDLKYLYPDTVIHFGFNMGNLFNVTAIPNSINITNAKKGNTFTVVYNLHATAKSEGIYDYTLPWDTCEQYPLTIGYVTPHLKASDFPLEVRLGRTCPNFILNITSVKIISGMNYTEINAS